MNGNLGQEAASAASMSVKKGPAAAEGKDRPVREPEHMPNGVDQAGTNGHIASARPNSPLNLADLPLEVRQKLQGAFMPLDRLIGRTAQDCWSKLRDMVDELAQTPAPSPPNGAMTNGYLPNGYVENDQSESNLNRKDRLLNFANDQRKLFVKLLVLLQWSKDAEDVKKALHINLWLHEQRVSYFSAAHEIGMVKRRLASFQIPNPDLSTAAKVLASRKVSEFPDLGYLPQKPLKTRRILRTLKSVNRILSSRLALSDELPPEFQDFRVHDGRVTFSVPAEFELDLTVMDEDMASRFHFLDFRFAFSPSSDLPEGSLHNDISLKINNLLEHDGLLGCYDFLHDMILSYKLSILYRQAVELSQGQFANQLRVELIRRTLVVQYWTSRPGAKSWIEIGVNSGRQRKRSHSEDRPKAFLQIKWMRELKEIEVPELVVDAAALSMDIFLRKVFASHASYLFDLVYNKMMAVPLYADGELLLEQTYSSTEPSECRLKIQLTKSKHATMTIESVTGLLVLSPATLLSNRLEYDMRQSKNIAEDVSQKLSHLRCALAEQDLISTAESTGWDIVRTFKVTQAEIRTLFSDFVFRVVFLRQPCWESEHMVAATHGPQGDHWWLLQRDVASANGASWTSQRIDSRPMHMEPAVSYQYLAQLASYTSGMIALQINAAYMAGIGLQFVLMPLPQFGEGYHLPKLSLDFQPDTLRAALSIEGMTTALGLSSLNLVSNGRSQHQSVIHSTVSISYCGFNRKSNTASMSARGQSSASRRVLKQLADSALDPLIYINPAKGTFALRIASPVGRPIVEEVLRRLVHLENIIACLTVVQEHRSLSIVSLSALHLSLRYMESSAGPALGFVIHFASPSSPVRMELWPPKSNPHIRIASQLSEVLADSRRSLPTNLRLLVPLLTYTYPLLSFLQTLQSLGDGGQSTSGPISDEQPRLHIMPRHATMYGIHYFVPPGVDPTMPADSEGSPRMLARLEILPSQRSKQSYWILRPAIEEFESYHRESFPLGDLNDKLKKEIFSKTDEEQGWIPLDQGAACPIDKPQRLLQALHDLIKQWLRDRHGSEGKAISKDGAAQGGINAPANQPAATRTQARAQPPQRVQASGNNQANSRAVAGAGRGNAQRNKEVIQLD